jgi:hypothetical protein
LRLHRAARPPTVRPSRLRLALLLLLVGALAGALVASVRRPAPDAGSRHADPGERPARRRRLGRRARGRRHAADAAGAAWASIGSASTRPASSTRPSRLSQRRPVRRSPFTPHSGRPRRRSSPYARPADELWITRQPGKAGQRRLTLAEEPALQGATLTDLRWAPAGGRVLRARTERWWTWRARPPQVGQQAVRRARATSRTSASVSTSARSTRPPARCGTRRPTAWHPPRDRAPP